MYRKLVTSIILIILSHLFNFPFGDFRSGDPSDHVTLCALERFVLTCFWADVSQDSVKKDLPKS